MVSIFADLALLPKGWASDVEIGIAEDGKIHSVRTGVERGAGSSVGIVLPAPVNVHSHTFQRAMAGLTERRGPNVSDSFWTWRTLMYRFLDHLTPEHVQAIAAYVQMEMLKAGYGTNVEFHYIHHQPNGAPYDKLDELTARIAAATKTSGIGLTHLPVHYQYGGCDKRELASGQVRFGNDIDRFVRLFEDVEKTLRTLPADTRIGLAPHSLRAVAPEHLKELSDLAGSRPVHLHIAEQAAEVEELRCAYGKRPVEWVLDNAPVDERWCMIHCTQMLPHETRELAKSGAVAGLCPITESSLGDGIFDCVNWLGHGGLIAIGSDSNIRISLSEEIRTLEYSQRLRDRSRAALAANHKSTARRIFDEMIKGGAQAADRKTGEITQGFWADLMALDKTHVNLQGRTGDTILDCFVFAGDDTMVQDVWTAGRHMVKAGRHIHHDIITAEYRQAMSNLGDVL